MSGGSQDEFMTTLGSILVNTYNGDRELRKQAEASLTNYYTLPNAFSGFLSLVARADGDPNVRMAAALALKNKVRHFWSDGLGTNPAPEFPMSPEEKEHVKVHIIDAVLAETNTALRTILAEILRGIAEMEFPTRWPALLPTLIANISGTDRLRVYNSLLALRKIVKRLEYKADEKRAPMYLIMEQAFPAIQTLLNNVVQLNIIEAAMVMHMSIKIFWSSIMYKLPAQGVNVDWGFWFQFLSTCLEKPLPEASEGLEPAGQPVEKEAREKWPWWKVKKWSSRIMQHIMSRYGNPKHVVKEVVEFAKHFRSQTAITLLGPIMNTLNMQARGGFVTSCVRRFCITYLSHAVEMAPTYKAIKPHIDFILFQVIYPALMMPEEDIELFNNDPIEFVRKIHSSSMDMLDHKHAAIALLETMAKYRTNDVLPMVMSFVQTRLDAYTAATGDEKEAGLYREKDALLIVVGNIAGTMVKDPSMSGDLEPFIINHVIPDFRCPCAFVRSRCCWILEWFISLDWEALAPSTLQAILDGLMHGLRDPSLAVQNSSACSLRTIVSAKAVQPSVRPIIGTIIQEYFRIMDEVENDAVLGALQQIVESFPEEIVPLAPMMVEKLVMAWDGYASHVDDDEASFAATNCLEGIEAILDKLDRDQNALAAVEAKCIPMLTKITSTERYFEYLESAIGLMTMFTYFADGITLSDGMWQCCGLLLEVLNTWAFDYIIECTVPLLNFMNKDISGFYRFKTAQGNSFIDLLLQVWERAITMDASDLERESKCACNLVQCFLACSHAVPAASRVPIIDHVFTLVVQKLTAAQASDADREERSYNSETYTRGAHTLFAATTPALATKVCEVGMALIYYDVHGTVATMNSDERHQQMTAAWFPILFENFPYTQGFTGSRLIALSLLQLLRLPLADLPPCVREQIVPVFVQVLREVDLLRGCGDDFYDPDVHDLHPRKKDTMSGHGGYGDWGDDDEDDDFVDADDFADADDDDADISEEDDGEDDGMGIHSKKAISGMAKNVPDGGYNEDEDCVATEDDEYYKMLVRGEDPDNTGMKYSDMMERFIDETEVDVEAMGDYEHVSPVDRVDLVRYFMECMDEVSVVAPAQLNEIRAHLGEDDNSRINELAALATQRKAAQQITDPQQRMHALRATTGTAKRGTGNEQ